ncbi:MAG TPA: PQQ-dependent sugar dehydrogenase [Ktedonobacterales bacterium]|nr:PQQ-dependent sugar dehydrogenase [Ktedonobacterales bacterium]
MWRRVSLLIIWGLALSMAVTACGSSTTTQPTATATHGGPAATTAPGAPLGPGDVHLQPFATGLRSPVHLTYAPGQTDRVYVVEQTGRVMVVGMDGAVRAQPFLDVHQLISTGGERGLLSIAFHPDYARNGSFFVDYTATDGTVTVVRYHVSQTDPYRADPASAQIILTVAHPVANHNGGLLLFGSDGYLYIGIGDGGSGNSANGQRKNTLLGKILRIDVDHTSAGRQYAIPSDNPFANQAGARPEIWAYGLRNPWRFSFDRSAHDLYIGDAGQNAVEEIDYQPAASKGGQNYGWAIYEGNSCYAGGSACSTGGLTAPVATYGHEDGNCVVVGGYVYRGQKYPSLTGAYFYGDTCSGRMWSFPAADARDGHVAAQQILDTPLLISSFGEDATGELYVVSLDGSVSRITV